MNRTMSMAVLLALTACAAYGTSWVEHQPNEVRKIVFTR